MDDSFLSSLSFGIDSNSVKGNFWDREYHGPKNNISARAINANLDQLSFTIDLGYGDESSYYVTGEYVITGRTGSGHFYLYGYSVTHCIPDFANLTLDGFEGLYKSEELAHSAYSLQFDDSPNTPKNRSHYMREVYLKTPIGDIIGDTVPPVNASSQALKSREHLNIVNGFQRKTAKIYAQYIFD